LLKADGHLLMLVKPQFELQPGQIGKGGIVRDAAHFAFVEQRLRDCCAELGVDVLGWMESSIEGGDGNREFFIHGKKGSEAGLEDKPLPAVPPRKAVKRTPRAETRALHRDVERFLRLESHPDRAGSKPLAFEVAFGMEEGFDEPLAIKEPAALEFSAFRLHLRGPRWSARPGAAQEKRLIDHDHAPHQF